ncbi:MAG: substrate-binding protein [Rhodospirillales bacterium]|nr:substrate-binding protein [Rhodospirillales bacterium]
MKLKSILQAIHVIGLLFFLTNCDSPPLAPIKIGVVLPLSGDFQIFGDTGTRGIKLAVKEINDAGGLLGGRKLELVIADNKTDPAESVRLARKMIQQDNVVALMGPVSSSGRNAMMEVAQEFKTPLLYGIDYEGGMYNRYLFCFSPIPDHYIKPIIPYLIENHGNSFYIFGYDYIWPHKMAEAIKREVTANKGTIAGVEFTPFGATDFTPVIEHIHQSKAKNLILIQPGPDGFNFLKQFTAAGMKKDVKVTAIASNESYIGVVKNEDLEGVLTSLQFIASAETPATKQFIKAHSELYGPESIVTYSTDSHYNLVKLLAQAIQKVGSLDKEKIIPAMEGVVFDTASGPVNMRSDHHVDLNILLAEFTRGQLLVKKDFGVISPANQKK